LKFEFDTLIYSVTNDKLPNMADVTMTDKAISLVEEPQADAVGLDQEVSGPSLMIVVPDAPLSDMVRPRYNRDRLIFDAKKYETKTIEFPACIAKYLVIYDIASTFEDNVGKDTYVYPFVSAKNTESTAYALLIESIKIYVNWMHTFNGGKEFNASAEQLTLEEEDEKKALVLHPELEKLDWTKMHKQTVDVKELEVMNELRSVDMKQFEHKGAEKRAFYLRCFKFDQTVMLSEGQTYFHDLSNVSQKLGLNMMPLMSYFYHRYNKGLNARETATRMNKTCVPEPEYTHFLLKYWLKVAPHKVNYLIREDEKKVETDPLSLLRDVPEKASIEEIFAANPFRPDVEEDSNSEDDEDVDDDDEESDVDLEDSEADNKVDVEPEADAPMTDNKECTANNTVAEVAEVAEVANAVSMDEEFAAGCADEVAGTPYAADYDDA
jgi:hypothetical protein